MHFCPLKPTEKKRKNAAHLIVVHSIPISRQKRRKFRLIKGDNHVDSPHSTRKSRKTRTFSLDHTVVRASANGRRGGNYQLAGK